MLSGEGHIGAPPRPWPGSGFCDQRGGPCQVWTQRVTHACACARTHTHTHTHTSLECLLPMGTQVLATTCPATILVTLFSYASPCRDSGMQGPQPPGSPTDAREGPGDPLDLSEQFAWNPPVCLLNRFGSQS